ncbi:MAG TPA: hypothetical protein VKF42_08965 [Chitinivibrionales bacterium]|nr:hypothetical protein [Chitinivibrionales bacterium]
MARQINNGVRYRWKRKNRFSYRGVILHCAKRTVIMVQAVIMVMGR